MTKKEKEKEKEKKENSLLIYPQDSDLKKKAKEKGFIVRIQVTLWKDGFYDFRNESEAMDFLEGNI